MVERIRVTSPPIEWSAVAGLSQIARCRSGDIIEAPTLDCRAGTIRGQEDAWKVDDASHINPLIGPVFVEDACAGDTLEVEILDIVPTGQPLMLVRPGVTAFDFVDRSAVDFPTLDAGHVTVAGIRAVARPMVGFLATAPKKGELPGSASGPTGGNMDNTMLRAGSRVLLPVEVDSAQVFIGDVHGRQGDGELFLTGVETPATITFSCRVRSSIGLNFPVCIFDASIAIIGEGSTLEDAATVAARRTVEMVVLHTDMSQYEAGFLVSALGDLRICRFLPNYGSVCRLELPLDVWESGYWNSAETVGRS